MLTTALLLMFASADVQPAFLTGGAPRKVRLVDEEVLSPPPPEALPSYAGWTRGQLRAEYERLGEKRPSLGMPIALMSSGGGALTLAAYILLGMLSSGINGVDVPLLVIVGVIATASAGTIVIGGIVLSRLLPERKIYGAQMEEVDRLIKESNELSPQRDDRIYVPPPPPIIGPPPEGPPPLPLPPFPQSSGSRSVSFPLIFARF